MFKKDVIEHFGTSLEVSKVLGISPAAVSQWSEVIPEKNAYRVQEITKGQLQVDHAIYWNMKSEKRDD